MFFSLFFFPSANKTKKNKFDEFLYKTYIEPLSKIFKSAIYNISNFTINFVCTPKKNRQNGRCLKYSEGLFFYNFLSFFSQNIDRQVDNIERTKEEQKQYLINLYNNLEKGRDTYLLAFSNELKSKIAKINDLKTNELSSVYYDNALKDYEEQIKKTNSNMSFREYLNSSYTIMNDLLKGLITVGDFFDIELNYQELYAAFDPDIFYLLFAKIIYETNITWEKEHNSLYDNFPYLIYYQEAIQNIIAWEPDYNPKLKTYILGNRSKLNHYSRRQFSEECNTLLAKHQNIKERMLSFDGINVKDVDLMSKLRELLDTKGQLNFAILPKDERQIKTYTQVENKKEKTEEKVIDEEQLKLEVNERINYLLNLGCLIDPVPGLNTFKGYYAFIYPNGIIVLEKFWENDNFKPARENATYILNIDNFIEMAKLSKPVLIEYIKNFGTKDIKRVFHEGNIKWEKDIYEEIHRELKYDLKDVLNFIDKLQREALNDERDL